MKMKKRNIIARCAAAVGRAFFRLFPKTYVVSNRLNHAVMRQSFKDVNQTTLLEFWNCFDFATLAPENYKHFGDREDGGYFLAFPIDKRSEVVSVGIGDNISFDCAISPYVSNIHMFDHTIQAPKHIPENACFYNKGIGVVTKGSLLDFQEILSFTKLGNPRIIKIDIEGGEWDILSSLKSDSLAGVSQVVIEFHNLIELLRDPRGLEAVFRILKSLKRDFWAININPNNWANSQIIHGVHFADVLEVTFLNKNEDRQAVVGSLSMRGYPNNPSSPQLLLGNFEEIFWKITSNSQYGSD